MDDAFEIRTTHVSKKDTLKIDTKLEKNMYDTFKIRMTHFGKKCTTYKRSHNI